MSVISTPLSAGAKVRKPEEVNENWDTNELVVPRADPSAVQYVHQADLTYNKDSVTSYPGGLSSSVTTTASSASSAQILAANTGRRALILSNSDANAFYGRFGSTSASTSAFSFIIASNATLQIAPAPVEALQGIWSSDGTGYIGVTELTA